MHVLEAYKSLEWLVLPVFEYLMVLPCLNGKLYLMVLPCLNGKLYLMVLVSDPLMNH